MKRCVLILPYFGKFNSYFQLFLNSCSTNEKIDWIIFTDNTDKYDYPSNVKKVGISFEEFKKIVQKKFEFKIALNTPYKLCDYKPMYGYILEEYIKDYEYWGHCDCDLLFGNLDKFIIPLLDKGYDKIFAMGHLTIYRNVASINSMFMKSLNGVEIYKDAITKNEIYVFDEDYKSEKNLNRNNIHSIFLENSKNIYSNDISFNVSTKMDKLTKTTYNPETRMFSTENFTKRRYYWENGNLFSLEVNDETKKLVRKEYIYMHFQMRKMRNKVIDPIIEIKADRFVSVSKIPSSVSGMNVFRIGFTYCRKLDILCGKIKRRMKK